MKINGIEGLTTERIDYEVQRGGKFVFYQYTISIFIMTFRRSSPIYFLKGGDSALVKGLPFTLISLVLGWWGIPWGPIWTIGSVYTNLVKGGKDITTEVMTALRAGTDPSALLAAE